MNATEQPIKHLVCAVCGAATLGRQWHNRDTGFGVCPSCFVWVGSHRPFGRDPETPEELIRLYGEPGVHHSLPEVSREG